VPFTHTPGLLPSTNGTGYLTVDVGVIRID